MAVLALCLSVALSGCSSSALNSESYPANLKYPQRQDLIVKKRPGHDETRLDSPGQLDESIAKGFKKGGEMLEPGKLSEAERRELREVLEKVFGTPAHPRIEPDLNLAPTDKEVPIWLAASETFKEWRDRKMAAQPDFLKKVSLGEMQEVFGPFEVVNKVLERGSRLYRRHCMHCHGVAGDGRGPTGAWVHPHPRDYRRGEFKFISTAESVVAKKPRREDLIRVLTQGIDGTSMPAFGLLPEDELQYLASYVIHLSMRGEVEQEAMRLILEKSPLLSPDDKEIASKIGKDTSELTHLVYGHTTKVLMDWAKSNAGNPMQPEMEYKEPATEGERFEDIRAGHKIFVSGCIACHIDYGRQSLYKYDNWGTLVRPFNLTTNTYRGGRRPIDLYYRFKGGIDASGMSAAPPATTAKQYWQLVAFVKALPYPAMLPNDLREEIYGPSKLAKATTKEKH